ncbi:MAG: 16S rRNA (guanine(966)-N(2))-methyltransferase RsmD [Steroidobacteraceae bacterium]
MNKTQSRQATAKAKSRAADARMLRIIAGRHRGRRLRVPAVDAIRPTPDRVRETLFNWLQGKIEGARCLDLFAGSGVLGLEALSRGATHVTLIERDRVAVDAIAAVVRAWGETGATVLQGDAFAILRQPSAAPLGGPLDIVFLDPPFESGALATAAALLERGDWLAETAYIYLEHRAREPLPALPRGWRPLKSGRAGEVEYHLWVRRPADAGPGDPIT